MRTRVGVLALLALLSVACGKIKGGSSDAAPEADAMPAIDAAPPGPCEPGGDPSAEEAYDCLVEAACKLVTRCFIPYTVEECKSLDLEIFDVRVFLHRPIVLDAIEAGTIQFHPEAVAACYSAMSENECTFLFERAGSDFAFNDLCPDIFTGTVAAEGTCFTDLECAAPGSACSFSPDCTADDFCCAGVCLSPAADDASCSANPCALGSYCVDGVCRTGEANSPCTRTSDCDQGLWCQAGTCQAELESGATCVNEEQCSGAEVCVKLDADKAGTCGRRDVVDAPCNEGCFGMECVQPDPTMLGTCQPYLSEEGDDCSQRECRIDFECTQATDQCDPRGDVGDPCSNEAGNRCKLSLFCNNEITGETTGVCSGRLADGEPCTSTDQCQSGVCAETCQPNPGCF
jgi:hypothetical protein